MRRPGFDPWLGKSPWRRPWQPTPVLLAGESLWTEEPGVLQSMWSQRVGVPALSHTYPEVGLEGLVNQDPDQKAPTWEIRKVDGNPV